VFSRNRRDNINFPMCFPETVKVILFTLTVYVITIKKFETVREFQVSISAAVLSMLPLLCSARVDLLDWCGHAPT
jgi:hypothetical protein